MRQRRARPGWLLLLLWAAVGALFVAPARPAPQPAHDEASPPSLARAVDETAARPDRDRLFAWTPPDPPGPIRLHELGRASDPPRAGPPARPVVFALLRRPPPAAPLA